MKRLLAIGAVAAVCALAGASTALGQSDRAVERSGRTFHVKVCPGSNAPGTARCHAHLVTDAAGQPVVAASPFALPSGYGPSQLRSAYNIADVGDGSVTIAIVDAYGYDNAEKDLANYRSTFGLTPCTTANGCFKKVNQLGQARNYPRQNTGWAQEAALDLQMASAICPGCKILLVQGNSASFSDLATAVDTAVALGAQVVSNSYGGSEAAASFEPHYNHPGVAITVSTGDSGYGVQFPASSPHVTAVGGTSLRTAANARGWTETAWSGAGSGCSANQPKPSWQTDTGCARRTVADVSAIADPNTGVAVYGPTNGPKSGWMVFGGTSVAAPIIAGVYGVGGGPFGTAQNLYLFTGSLFDVTSGNTGACNGSYLCTAVAGFDGPTGWGTPNGPNAF